MKGNNSATRMATILTAATKATAWPWENQHTSLHNAGAKKLSAQTNARATIAVALFLTLLSIRDILEVFLTLTKLVVIVIYVKYLL